MIRSSGVLALLFLSGYWIFVFASMCRPRWITRLVSGLAGDLVDRDREQRTRALESAHIPGGYRQYAAFTILYSLTAAISGAVIVGVSSSLLLSTTGFDSTARLVTVMIAAGWLGIVCGISIYWFRWWWPTHTAAARGRRIDATMPRTVAFLYALSRSGMTFPDVLSVFAAKEGVYGETAIEISLTVREMDLAGADLVSALERTAARTPSGEFEEFLTNTVSVLKSGQDLPGFLEAQYDRYQDEAEANQQRLLTQFATLAEVYVTTLVAGPLFLLTILVVIGLTLDETLSSLQLLVYLVLPLLNLVFIIYLSTLTEPLRPGTVGPETEIALGGTINIRKRNRTLPDGGTIRTTNEDRLAFYARYCTVFERVSSPVKTLTERPERLLALTLPLAVLVSLGRLWEPFSGGALDAQQVDDVLIQSGLFVLGSYALVATACERRIGRVEAALPDVLARLASINEAGVSITDSIDRVQKGDLGSLSPEFERIWRDIEWGADLNASLWRFERRVKTVSVTRMVVLVTNAASASGRLAPVLRITAQQGHAERRLERDRKGELLTYLIVIYLSFFVFALIVLVLNNVLIPSLPEPTTDLEATGANFGGIETDAYSLVFGHALVIQGALSGYVAGRMGEASVRSGAKHATILASIAYLIFLLI
jgi:flagellar protein FlaJ